MGTRCVTHYITQPRYTRGLHKHYTVHSVLHGTLHMVSCCCVGVEAPQMAGAQQKEGGQPLPGAHTTTRMDGAGGGMEGVHTRAIGPVVVPAHRHGGHVGRSPSPSCSRYLLRRGAPGYEPRGRTPPNVLVLPSAGPLLRDRGAGTCRAVTSWFMRVSPTSPSRVLG